MIWSKTFTQKIGCVLIGLSTIHCQLIDNRIKGTATELESSGPDPAFSLLALNYPEGINAEKALNITITGESLVAYRYKIGDPNVTDCMTSAGYSSSVNSKDVISDDLSTVNDGYLKLCVIGKNGNTGIWQDFASASEFTWGKDTGQPSEVSVENSEFTVHENGGQASLNISISAPKINDVTINYTVGGTSVAGVDHDLLTGTLVIPSGQLSGQINFNLLDNGNTTGDLFLSVGISSVSEDTMSIGNNSFQNIVILDDELGIQVGVKEVSAGERHSCQILLNGNLECWGNNEYGQLGDGTLIDKYTPTLIDVGVSYARIALGPFSTCGIVVATGELKCWGNNTASQLGDGTTVHRSSPTTIDSGESYQSIVLGATHGCGIVSVSGQVKCWGVNGNGQLGDGTGLNRSTPTDIASTTNYESLSVGNKHSCAIAKTTGELNCWGYNHIGQIGDETPLDRLSPVIVDSGVAYKSLDLGGYVSCGITVSSEELRCWGDNSFGQYGNGSTINSPSPISVQEGVTYTAISVGGNHSCGTLKDTGELRCWGRNTIGQLGDGALQSQLVPITIDTNESYLTLSAGSLHSCAILKESNALKCWGSNTYGAIGIGTIGHGPEPTVVTSEINYASVNLGSNRTCALTSSDGKLMCWGDNTNGYLGDGTTYNRSLPTLIHKDISYEAVAIGKKHTCGIEKNTGELWCWGRNNLGQLGDGTFFDKSEPVAIDTGVSYDKVATGRSHTCGITTVTGTLKCWGNNSAGQLGLGAAGVMQLIPIEVDVGTAYSEISLGDDHSCGLVSLTGELKCWGQNTFGQLGDGGNTERSAPFTVDSGVFYETITLGGVHTCGLVKNTGVLKCWGFNLFGQLGTAIPGSKPNPSIVDSGVFYEDVAAGTYHSCGIIRSTGILRCWGNLTGNTTPTTIDIVNSYESLSLGDDHSCAIHKNTGILACWGDNEFGQTGTLNSFAIPRLVIR